MSRDGTHFDVLVLSAGPGGYTTAARAAQLRRSVAVVEDKYWGGVCLNVGCIPSKALLRNADVAHLLNERKEVFSIVGDACVDYQGTWQRCRSVADASVTGVHYLMKKNKVTEIEGWGSLSGSTSIDVKRRDGATAAYTFDNLILATGATVRLVPGVTLSENVVTYEEQILTDQLTLLGALRMRWHTRLAGQIECELMGQPRRSTAT